MNNPGYRNVTFDELVENYTEATKGLIEGGADLNDDSDERSKQTDYEKTRYMLNWQHKGGLDSRVLTQVS